MYKRTKERYGKKRKVWEAVSDTMKNDTSVGNLGDLSKRIGCNHYVLTRFFSGTNSISSQDARMIAKYFNIPLAEVSAEYVQNVNSKLEQWAKGE